MNQLTLEIVHKGKAEKREFSFPEGYADFSLRELRILVKCFLTSGEDELWFVKLIRDFICLSKKELKAMDIETCHQLEQYFTYLKDGYVNAKSPAEKIGLWRGPKNNLKNYSIERLGYVDSFAQAYHETQEDKYLDSFFAHAYSLGGMRWNKNARISTFFGQFVSKETKLVALKNFDGLRANLVKDHPNTFEGGEEESEMAQFAWTGTILNLAGPKFGPFNEARQTKVPEAFALFEMNGIMIKKREKEAKKNGG